MEFVSLSFFSFFSFLLLLHQPRLLLSQQVYVDNKQLDCENPSNNNITEGFSCTGPRTSCRAYVTFRSTAVYSSLLSVAYLLNSQPYISEMTSINNLTDVEPLAPDTLVIAPVDCACTSSSPSYYQHNASYVIQESDTYFILANDTYQGLSTCQALMAENPYDALNLSVGMNLTVPVRCACPTTNQSSAGAKYLLSYLVTWGDTIFAIAKMFGVSGKSVLDANELTEKSVIYPFTPILVPLSTEPTKIVTAAPPASPPEVPSVLVGGN
ncbi:hypothetical protein ACJRO7_025460 [Eucalyptus globulus]|uniref:LysM domain-containing protein n=1 Tax=Eucalyptus globulus TaxID=34317 RepID=A0ABD3KL82_EUCGL